jgi:hypothetical protein
VGAGAGSNWLKVTMQNSDSAVISASSTASETVHIPAAAAGFVAAFYLLARSVTAMRLISANPVAGQDTLSQQVTRALVDGLGYLLPALDRWTDTAWLVNAAPEPSVLLAIVAQGTIYIGLLAAATLFDFYRRSL